MGNLPEIKRILSYLMYLIPYQIYSNLLQVTTIPTVTECLIVLSSRYIHLKGKGKDRCSYKIKYNKLYSILVHYDILNNMSCTKVCYEIYKIF